MIDHQGYFKLINGVTIGKGISCNKIEKQKRLNQKPITYHLLQLEKVQRTN